MDIDIAILVAGVLIMVGGIVGGGAIYAGLEKLANAMKKQMPTPRSNHQFTSFFGIIENLAFRAMQSVIGKFERFEARCEKVDSLKKL